MTQVFDPEDGHVERVTVIEAGPCFVTGIRRADRDGYDAVQLGLRRDDREAAQQAEARPAQEGRRRQPAPPARVPRRAGRARGGRRAEGRRRVRAGQTVKVSGRLEGQGLRRHDQAPQLLAAARSRTARTTCARRARSAPPPTPRACSRASAARARWATSASPSAGSRSSTCRPDENLLLVRGSVPGRQGHGRRDQERGLMAAGVKYIGGGTGTLALDDAVFGERFHGPLVHEAVRAELAARRRGTASTKTRGEVAMTGAKAWRQKGTGRARVGALSTPNRVRRRRGLRPQAARLHGQGQPQGAPPRAARRAVGARRARLARRGRPVQVRHPLHQGGRRGARQVRRRGPRARGRSTDGEETCAQVLPQPRGRDRAARRPGRRRRRDRRRAGSSSPRPRSRASPRRRWRK